MQNLRLMMNRVYCVSRRLTNICVVIFEGLSKRWHGISGGWADLRECVSNRPANTCVLIFEDLGEHRHGGAVGHDGGHGREVQVLES